MLAVERMSKEDTIYVSFSDSECLELDLPQTCKIFKTNFETFQNISKEDMSKWRDRLFVDINSLQIFP